MTTNEQTTDSVQNTPVSTKMGQGRKAGAIMFPRNSLTDALRVAKSIWNDNAGHPFPIGDLATQLNYSPTSGNFRDLIRSANRYGIIEGSWVQDTTKTIGLSSLGLTIVAPKVGEDPNSYTLQALQIPEVFSGFLNSINGRVIPPEDVCKSTLIREQHIIKSDVDSCYVVLMKNIQELNLTVDNTQGKQYLRLDKLSANIPTSKLEETIDLEGIDGNELQQISTQSEDSTPEVPTKEIPKQIFVAHGKNKRPLEQLEKILNKFKVNYTIASDEPHEGRPISAKVADLMKNSTSGIFIFTADEKTIDEEGKEIWRPSQNVVYELGAASVLFGKKIVILKEKDVLFASDFSDLGYISFEKDQLDAKAADLMLELINLGFMQLTPT